ncbi:MAG: transmembrane anchor protein [Pseudomonadota bacterium]
MYNSDLPTRAELPSTGQLLRSTAIALATAAILLITVILPSEYAIDPTGVGRVLGLTEMGEIKQQLAEEAALDADRSAIGTTPVEVAPEAIADPVEIADIEAVVEDAPPVNEWTDEVRLQLSPGEAAEIKLVMPSGAVVEFEWVAEPGHLNSALHGDGTAGEAITYRNGRAEPGHSDSLTAAFDGTHGWFWRNRSDETVTMTLRVRGRYTEIKRVI